MHDYDKSQVWLAVPFRLQRTGLGHSLFTFHWISNGGKGGVASRTLPHQRTLVDKEQRGKMTLRLSGSIYRVTKKAKKALARKEEEARNRLARYVASEFAAGRKPSQEYVDVINNTTPEALKKAIRHAEIEDIKRRKRILEGRDRGFYNSFEWKELRYKTLQKYGSVCQCCGSTKKPMHVDHIKPRSKHPELALKPENLQILCEACNIGKLNKDETDWRMGSLK